VTPGSSSHPGARPAGAGHRARGMGRAGGAPRNLCNAEILSTPPKARWEIRRADLARSPKRGRPFRRFRGRRRHPAPVPSHTLGPAIGRTEAHGNLLDRNLIWITSDSTVSLSKSSSSDRYLMQQWPNINLSSTLPSALRVPISKTAKEPAGKSTSARVPRPSYRFG
jgi:hypothetical protein